jgi:WD40 repeat protein
MYAGKIGRCNGLAIVGETLVQIGSDNRRHPLILWRTSEAKAATFPLSGEDARSRAIAPDASCVIESDNAGTHVYAIDPRAPKTPPKHRCDLPSKGKAWCLALSNSGRFAAAGFWDGTVRVYDTAALESGNSDPADAVVFDDTLSHTPTRAALTADGRRLAVFSREDGLLLVDLESGERRLMWGGGAASVSCVKFTADDKLIAGLSDGTARMWSVADGGALLVIEAGHVPRDIAWSAEASLLATAAGKVNLWKCELP